MKKYVLMGAVLLVLAVVAFFILDAQREETQKETAVIAANRNSDVLADITPDNFVRGVTNPYLTLKSGTAYTYQVKAGEETEIIKVAVTERTRLIMGVTAIEVVDTKSVDGKVAEQSTGWYAEDKSGNVWLLGEHAEEEGGTVISWVAGDGQDTVPGIYMKSEPEVGDTYLNDYYKGISESGVGVVSLTEAVTVPRGSYQNCLKLREWTPQEPDTFEYKYYCKEIGGQALSVLYEGGVEAERTELIDLTTKL